MLLLFPAMVGSFSTGILGKWRPGHLTNVMIHVMEEKVVGTMDDKHSVEMKIIKQDMHEICLDDIQLKQKSLVWFNVIKFKEYINIFQKIRQFGITCQYDFVDEKSIEILSKIGNNEYRFYLEKVLEEEC